MNPLPARGEAKARAGRAGIRFVAGFLCTALIATAVRAQEQKKQPPPEFTSYRLPGVTAPGPRAELFSYLDVILLVVALGLAAYFVLYKRSRRDLRVVLFFSLLYFGFYRHGCVCSIGAIQNVALAASQERYALPFAAGAFFVLPLIFALFFGRVFCSGVCPLGAIQDLVLIRPRRLPVSLDHALGVVPYVYLGAAVLFAATGTLFLICDYDPFIGFFRLGGPQGVVGFGAALLLLGTVVGRPYCRFLCPYGVLLRWAAPVGKRRVTITPSRCIQCHLCADACPFGAIRPPTPASDNESRSAERRRLGIALLALPAIVALSALLGYLSAPALAQSNHSVALAVRIGLEDAGKAPGVSEAAVAYRNSGQSIQALIRRAADTRRRFEIGSALLGAWIGLVVAWKLASLSLRRTSADYEADPAACLSCARCFTACPVEQERLTGVAVSIPLYPKPVCAQQRPEGLPRLPVRTRK